MSEQLPYFERMKLIKLGLLPKEAVAKPKKYLNRVSEKKKKEIAEQKEKGSDKTLDQWFDEIEEKYFSTGYGVCMETGDSIPRKYARAATAHLLPKKLFKSVATHELNFLILSPLNGSHQKTDRIDKFVTMKIWPEAARRIKLLIPLLPFEELRHISNQLDLALENTDV